MHDPTALIAILMPDAFTWQRGAVRVATEGIFRGCSIMNKTERVRYYKSTPWCDRPQVEVAVDVDVGAVLGKIRSLITA